MPAAPGLIRKYAPPWSNCGRERADFIGCVAERAHDFETETIAWVRLRKSTLANWRNAVQCYQRILGEPGQRAEFNGRKRARRGNSNGCRRSSRCGPGLTERS